MDKYNDLKNFIDNFIDKFQKHALSINDSNKTSILKRIEKDKMLHQVSLDIFLRIQMQLD